MIRALIEDAFELICIGAFVAAVVALAIGAA